MLPVKTTSRTAVVGYPRLRRRDAVAAEARQRLLGYLRALGPVREGNMSGGTAYGVEIDVLYWLLGPIPLTSIERDARGVRSG